MWGDEEGGGGAQNTTAQSTDRGGGGAQNAKVRTAGFDLTCAAAFVKSFEAKTLPMSASAVKAKMCLFISALIGLMLAKTIISITWYIYDVACFFLDLHTHSEESKEEICSDRFRGTVLARQIKHDVGL